MNKPELVDFLTQWRAAYQTQLRDVAARVLPEAQRALFEQRLERCLQDLDHIDLATLLLLIAELDRALCGRNGPVDDSRADAISAEISRALQALPAAVTKH